MISSKAPSLFVIVVLATSIAVLAADNVSQGQPTLEIVSVTTLNDQQAARRTPDATGHDVCVRLKLVTHEKGVRLYSWKDSVLPGTFLIQRKEGKILWLRGRSPSEMSPGVKGILFGAQGTWMFVPPNTSIEWEETDSTIFAGQEHAFSVLLKDSTKSEYEVSTSWFRVPDAPR